MILGNKTIQYSIYDRTNGRPEYVGDTSSYKRPSLEMLTDTIKGAGILGEIDLPTLGQIGALEAEISFKKSNKKAVEIFGQKSHSLEIRWASDLLDSSNGQIKAEQNKEIIRCLPKKLDLGKVETNTSNEGTLTLEVLYYQYIINGETLIEIDKLNNVLKVNGVDYAAAIRQAL